MSYKIIIIGANGQIGTAMANYLGAEYNSDIITLARNDLDITNYQQIEQVIASYQPDIVINAAAYTNVDGAEQDYDKALMVNYHAVAKLAKYCALYNAILLHYSTDYVFSGEGNIPYHEESPTSPLNKYGKSKLLGEQAILAAHEQYGLNYLIFRISWVYEHQKRNFFTTMLRLGAERDKLAIVADQYGAPGYAPDLARLSADIATIAISSYHRHNFPSGIYHLTHKGEVSWWGFAQEIFAAMSSRGYAANKIPKINAIATSQFPTPAKRPHNSRLSCSLVDNKFGVKRPYWQDGLERAVREYYLGN